MKRGLILVVMMLAVILCGSVWSVAYAQQKTASVGVDEIKAMLLRSAGWLVEWRGSTNIGVNDYIFEARGENIVVKINNPTYNMVCERIVTINSDDIKFDACWDTNITLRFDPDDQEYPFKGESQKVNYKLKVK